MNKEQIIQQVMNELRAQTVNEKPTEPATNKSNFCFDQGAGGLTEFVGSSPLGDSLGFVIANIDSCLHEVLEIDPKYRSIGVITARSGAGPHAMTADEAVKSTNVELIRFEMPNDTKGGGGHGNLMLFGAQDVSDARRAVEITLNGLPWAFGGVIGNPNAFIEVQYTARAGHVLSKYLSAEEGKAWGLINGCPAGIGVLMADAALKAADVKLAGSGSPTLGAHTNEYTILITGDSGAVKQSVCTAREIGIKLVSSLGIEPVPAGHPYF